jgi:hypothetical protein
MATAAWKIEHGIAIGSQYNTASKNKSIVRGLQYHRRCYRALEAYAKTLPESELMVEPWLRRLEDKRLRQPDAILVDRFTNTAIVIEVKMNWKDGRDTKLIQEYLVAAKAALAVDYTWPALITGNVRGYRGTPLLGLGELHRCQEWRPGTITPVVLLP